LVAVLRNTVKYRWTRDLVIVVLQDMIRRTRENGRWPINKDLASCGLPRPRGRPPKHRISKHLVDQNDVTIPLAPLPDRSSPILPPSQTTKPDEQLVQVDQPSLVNGSMEKWRNEYPAIQADIMNTPMQYPIR
jgi:hypothetical protein